MAFCKNCGVEINEGTAFCPNCGTKQDNGASNVVINGEPQPQVQPQPQYNTQPQVQPQPQYNTQPQYNAQPPVVDNGGFGWGLLGCCIPLVGLILFLVWKDNKPKTAKAAGIGAIVGVVLCALYYIVVLASGVGAAMYGSF